MEETKYYRSLKHAGMAYKVTDKRMIWICQHTHGINIGTEDISSFFVMTTINLEESTSDHFDRLFLKAKEFYSF